MLTTQFWSSFSSLSAELPCCRFQELHCKLMPQHTTAFTLVLASGHRPVFSSCLIIHSIQVDLEGDCASGSFPVAGIPHLMSLPISPHLCSSPLYTHFCPILCPCLTPSLHPVRSQAGMNRCHTDILEVHFAGEGVQQTEGLFSVNIPNPRLMNGGWCSQGIGP